MKLSKLLKPNSRSPLRHPKGKMSLRKLSFRGVCLTAATMLFACAHYPANMRLKNAETVKKVQEARSRAMKRSEDLFLVLAFSGGGTRAAVLSYGILEALAAVELPAPGPSMPPSKPHVMLQEVDVVTGVSGGSFTAAYYGLHGDRIFKDYRERFLTRKVRNDLLKGVLNPVNWFRLWSSKYGKSDLAAEYYDKILFDGATLGDMFATEGPFIHIQATDMVDGLYFGFTPAQFQLICSDLNTFPVARAVAASAAFPGPFTPIVLNNYAGQCGVETPQWAELAIKERDTTSRRFHSAMQLKAYSDAEKKPYIYLLDGGIADNLGIRGPTEMLAAKGGPEIFLGEIGVAKPQNVAFIMVNAATQIKYEWDRLGNLPGLGDIIGATSSTMVNSYNFDTLSLLRFYVEKWRRESKASGGEPPPKVFIIEVGFYLLSDDEERKSFNEIPTDLQLSEKDVDRLRNVASRLLFSSKEFQIFVKSIGGRILQ
jgi:NTE family protein